MGFGNLNPGSGAIAGAYGDTGCECCCSSPTHNGQIRRTFFPWIRKIRLSTPKGSQEFDPPSGGISADIWSFSKVDEYPGTSFGSLGTTPSGSAWNPNTVFLQSPWSDCEVEWLAYPMSFPNSTMTPTRFRDPDCEFVTNLNPVANHSAQVQFSCVNGRPSVRIILGTGMKMSYLTTALNKITVPTGTVQHSGIDMYIRHSSPYFYQDAIEVEAGVTYRAATVPLVGLASYIVDHSADMAASAGVGSYSEGQVFAWNEFSASLSPGFNPLGILGCSLELLP
jgi:hypothetical protein